MAIEINKGKTKLITIRSNVLKYYGLLTQNTNYCHITSDAGETCVQRDSSRISTHSSVFNLFLCGHHSPMQA